LKDFAAMANASGGILIIGIRDADGRPLLPLKSGLQSVRNVDQQINSLHQLVSTHFGEVPPKLEMRSIGVLNKRLLLVKVFKGAEFVGGKKKPDGSIEYPIRRGRITEWISPK
jgi:predicted HTH transcriptional regulator